MKAAGTFTCGHCGAVVGPGDWPGHNPWRNHCPECLWSKHVEIGDQASIGKPPCGEMMKPHKVDDEEVVWRCLGCGFTMRGFTDEYLHRNAGKFGGAVPVIVTVYPEEFDVPKRIPG